MMDMGWGTTRDLFFTSNRGAIVESTLSDSEVCDNAAMKRCPAQYRKKKKKKRSNFTFTG